MKSYKRDRTYNKNVIIVNLQSYNRNLLGGLYRENPVKSRNYEAVKSSKKWENVGNSYIIPALLLYRYSYTAIPIFERQIQVILFFLFQF